MIEGSSIRHVPGRAVRVVDTTGNGDAFIGAMSAALAEGADLVAAAYRANDASAYVATREGAQSSYPDATDLEVWLREAATETTAMF